MVIMQLSQRIVIVHNVHLNIMHMKLGVVEMRALLVPIVKRVTRVRVITLQLVPRVVKQNT